MANGIALVAYFSRSGNTQVVANAIHEITGGDVFRIVTSEAYPASYDAVVEVARKELKSRYRPALSKRLAGVEPYGTVFVGYPDWWSTMPMAVFTFLEQFDFSGKQIAPFCTHEGSGLGRSAQDIKEVCPRATVLPGLAIRGGSVKKAGKEVQAWLHGLGFPPA
jgi:flavodoxin